MITTAAYADNSDNEELQNTNVDFAVLRGEICLHMLLQRLPAAGFDVVCKAH